MVDFSLIIRPLLKKHRLRVRRWRTNMSGRAWREFYRDGKVINWIECPRPRTQISLAIFLHEVGHHVIGFEKYRRRCEEEYHAWHWALAEMRRRGIEPNARVCRRFEMSMRYAVNKALRRGIKSLPEPLQPFMPKAA